MPAQWVSQYGDYLFSVAMLKVGNKETAEDLVQETFISAIKAKDSFRSDSSEKTWLTAILNNKIIDHYRKKDVLKNVTEYIDDTGQSFSNSFFKENGHWQSNATPQLWKEDADTAVNRSEFYRILQYCIHKMPAKLVPVFTARFLENEDSDTICKDFNITPSNYWVIIHRAKVLMRSCLEKNWFVK
ncbi:RNA polymerase sigma-70 factor, ECF subfamily [Filimonas lacunae]|uniref:RNA polymerase sigma factor n=2 Tax=Filimonas lacunae TaxID=477680 RepID=A0A1N7KMI5_9BACT|nr:RNA polymerase sigma-70 factor, ECF subfamily [Filimonas lacunae]